MATVMSRPLAITLQLLIEEIHKKRSSLIQAIGSHKPVQPTPDEGLSAKSLAAPVHTFLTPRNPQENHAGQHFWPNLFLGRWLKGGSWCFREK